MTHIPIIAHNIKKVNYTSTYTLLRTAEIKVPTKNQDWYIVPVLSIWKPYLPDFAKINQLKLNLILDYTVLALCPL